jgi:hypothetical protein
VVEQIGKLTNIIKSFQVQYGNAWYQHFFQRRRKEYEEGKACDEREACSQGHGQKA